MIIRLYWNVKMTRPKTRSDEQVLEAALRLMHEHGPEALTFERLAKACGLSGATLVQRFKNKARLKQRTLLHAWDDLDDKTRTLATGVARTPAGAIELLVALSQGYGGIESYAEGLLVLREDLRDPVLRARGATWKAFLCAALAACFAEIDDPPPDVGLLMASHWQGALLWWSFDPTIEVAVYVEDSLNRFVAAITTATARKP
ncbi:TetR/AcrR family transcriptional regulator [Mesorhizobium sp. M00.F.Ca.ET.151.01.1.1]|nr:TetR/AcrR family transcriptional regulator [Mesorhizobium sp. M8A.F.Ca.ET.059.01.1.1]RVD50834.1 TetR/AcrR family transcriptional regulator [Mesorhizobium sp. M8A.F.Ca.ET.023.02.2.1]RWC80889.1 MAG: TetR/AcrR family transcriptional regulator [Mesorhizobium sp.]TGQ92555.1 TetR/AcrR family transcriptional regulator [Mesorhizobium sp. M8A.F.Ca.ET.208.01.1.1]TGR23263.1 TetR/AcrR family transcriptional regulator [Mesorhizobium sp. M8A.F.Ca.ET.202.01.1.1]TGR24497.1 TetR/AcrR family transcriptional 